MEKDFFNEKNIPVSNWMKFIKLEDRITGTLLSVLDSPAEGQFKPQKVYELEVKEGDTVIIDGEKQEAGVWYVGISVNKRFIISSMKRANIGQKVGFKFTKEIPATQKGFSPIKSVTPYIGAMDPSHETNDEPPFGNNDIPV